MKRIEIEIDDDTDALLEAMIAGDEASKPAILRGFVESGVLRMAADRAALGLGASSPARTPFVRRQNGADHDLDGRSGAESDELAPPDSLDAIVGSIHDDPVDGHPPDPLDALVGKYEGEAGDIDEVVYGR